METNSVNGDIMIEKIALTVNKVTKGIAVPMLLITASSTLIHFASGQFGWGTTMLLCSAWWAFVIYQYFIDKQS